MATRLAFAAVFRVKPLVLRVPSVLKARGRYTICHACHPYHGTAAAVAPISSSSPSPRKSTRGEIHTAAASTARPASAAAAAAAAAATRPTLAAISRNRGNATFGTATTGGGDDTHAKDGSSPAAKSTSSETVSSDSSEGGDSGASGGDGRHRGPLSWAAVGLAGIVATLAVGYYRMLWEEKQNQTASKVTSTGKPALGGPFTLVNMHGKPVTEKDYHGSFILLYFGFCHCPDICPSELVKIGSIASKLEGKLGTGVVKPVFVSVDPDRDSLAQLKHYAQDFHPSVEFLTGTKDQVAKAAKAYRVYFSKTEEHEEGEDYLLDHSIVIYLLAPNGDFLDFYTQRTTIADCVDRTVKSVKDFKA